MTEHHIPFSRSLSDSLFFSLAARSVGLFLTYTSLAALAVYQYLINENLLLTRVELFDISKYTEWKWTRQEQRKTKQLKHEIDTEKRALYDRTL